MRPTAPPPIARVRSNCAKPLGAVFGPPPQGAPGGIQRGTGRWRIVARPADRLPRRAECAFFPLKMSALGGAIPALSGASFCGRFRRAGPGRGKARRGLATGAPSPPSARCRAGCVSAAASHALSGTAEWPGNLVRSGPLAGDRDMHLKAASAPPHLIFIKNRGVSDRIGLKTALADPAGGLSAGSGRS